MSKDEVIVEGSNKTIKINKKGEEIEINIDDREKINRMKLIASRFYFAGSVGNSKASNKDDDMLF